jgi:hypothetical protein
MLLPEEQEGEADLVSVQLEMVVEEALVDLEQQLEHPEQHLRLKVVLA